MLTIQNNNQFVYLLNTLLQIRLYFENLEKLSFLDHWLAGAIGSYTR